MLIMRRRAGEAIAIGENIEIQVLEIAAGRVKLAISAPEHVAISRKEVRLTAEQNVQAARSPNPEHLAALLDRFRSAADAVRISTPNSLKTGQIIAVNKHEKTLEFLEKLPMSMTES